MLYRGSHSSHLIIDKTGSINRFPLTAVYRKTFNANKITKTLGCSLCYVEHWRQQNVEYIGMNNKKASVKDASVKKHISFLLHSFHCAQIWICFRNVHEQLAFSNWSIPNLQIVKMYKQDTAFLYPTNRAILLTVWDYIQNEY